MVQGKEMGPFIQFTSNLNACQSFGFGYEKLMLRSHPSHRCRWIGKGRPFLVSSASLASMQRERASHIWLIWGWKILKNWADALCVKNCPKSAKRLSLSCCSHQPWKIQRALREIRKPQPFIRLGACNCNRKSGRAVRLRGSHHRPICGKHVVENALERAKNERYFSHNAQRQNRI